MSGWENQPVSGDRVLALTAAQRETWSASPGTHLAGDLATAVELRSVVDLDALEVAIRMVAADTEALRARVVNGPDGATQVIGPALDWDLPIVDLRASADPRGSAEAWLRSELAHPLDLEEAPWFRQALVRCTPELTFWYLRTHAVLLDAYGHWLLTRRVADVSTRLMREVPDEDEPFPPLAQLVDADRRPGEAPAVCLPTTPPSTTGLTPSTRHSVPVAAELRSGLSALGAATGGDWPVALIAATAVAVSTRAAKPEPVLGLTVLNRRPALTRRIPGKVATIAALPVSVHAGLTWRELVASVADGVRELLHDPRPASAHSAGLDAVLDILPGEGDLRFDGRLAPEHHLAGGIRGALVITAARRIDGGLAVTLSSDAAGQNAAARLNSVGRVLADFLRLLHADPDGLVPVAG